VPKERRYPQIAMNRLPQLPVQRPPWLAPTPTTDLLVHLALPSRVESRAGEIERQPRQVEVVPRRAVFPYRVADLEEERMKSRQHEHQLLPQRVILSNLPVLLVNSCPLTFATSPKEFGVCFLMALCN